MNPRQRLLTTLRRERADRVPLILEGFHYRDLATVEAEPDPLRRAFARRVLPEMVYYEEVPSLVNRYLVTPPARLREVARRQQRDEITITTAIDTPRGTLTAITGANARTNTTWTVKYPVESREDVEKIRSIPWELPVELAAPDAQEQGADFATRGIRSTRVSSPFVCVAGMMPFETFLEWCATEMGLLLELTAQCEERIHEVLGALLAPGDIEYVWLGGCEWLTPPMASRRAYETLVQPFEQRLIAQAHAAGAICHVHCHGRVRSTLGLALERGADFFEPMEPPPDGDITLAEAKALCVGRMVLGGNVEARLLENESPTEVEAATRAAFAGGGAGMVLQSTAGPLGAMSERMAANYHRLMDVWEEMSPLS
jgi:hypothetical protein